jgi:hypothetical protein
MQKKFGSFPFWAWVKAATPVFISVCGPNSFAQFVSFVTNKMRETPVAPEAAVGASQKLFSSSFHSVFGELSGDTGPKSDFDTENPCKCLV